MPGLNPQRSGKGVRSENASRNAYVMRRNVYDLHRKFGSEMATESSRKIDGENPSLSGISHAARAFSLPARRGGPCKQFEAHGLTAYGLFSAQALTACIPDNYLTS